MAQIAPQPYSETQRMELRSAGPVASEIIAYYWPMRTFVHHNPLHGLEDLAFEKAVGRAQLLLGGNGYLTKWDFSRLLSRRANLPRHLDTALRPRAHTRQVRLGARDITHLDVLRACLLTESFQPRRR